MALGYLALLVRVPVILVFVNAFQDGIAAAWEAVTTPEAQHALLPDLRDGRRGGSAQHDLRSPVRARR